MTGNFSKINFDEKKQQPICLILISLLSICAGWLLRSDHIAGDGLMIVRITEHGRWLVNNELAGQVIVQSAFRIGQLFQLTAFEILQILSILFGTAGLLILCYGGKKYFKVPYVISCLIFFSTGYLLYTTGHTEYYPILLPVLFLYGYCGIAYIRGECTIRLVLLSYFIGVSIHLALLIALPSLLLLPFLRKRFKDYLEFSWLILGIGFLILFRDFSHITGYQPVRLGSGWSVLPLFEYGGMKWRYAFFSWGHWVDWLYGLNRRSFLLWPLIVVQVIILKPSISYERIFLFCYTICFTIWTLFWHPDLGIQADWDLFALETAPAILLFFSLINSWQMSINNKSFIILITIIGLLVQLSYASNRAEWPNDGYGQLVVLHEGDDQLSLTIEGNSYPLEIKRIREGRYSAKLIDHSTRRAIDFFVDVNRNNITVIDYQSLFKEPH